MEFLEVPAVFLQLQDEALVGVDECPFLFDLSESLNSHMLYLLEGHLVPPHDVGDHQGSTPGNAHLAVYEHIPLRQALAQKGIGFVEVGVDVGKGLILYLDLQVLQLLVVVRKLLPYRDHCLYVETLQQLWIGCSLLVTQEQTSFPSLRADDFGDFLGVVLCDDDFCHPRTY